MLVRSPSLIVGSRSINEGARSIVAATTVEVYSLFGVYVYGGVVITLSACVNPAWAHRAFQTIVFFTVISSLVWFGVQARELAAKRKIT